MSSVRKKLQLISNRYGISKRTKDETMKLLICQFESAYIEHIKCGTQANRDNSSRSAAIAASHYNASFAKLIKAIENLNLYRANFGLETITYHEVCCVIR